MFKFEISRDQKSYDREDRLRIIINYCYTSCSTDFGPCLDHESSPLARGGSLYLAVRVASCSNLKKIELHVQQTSYRQARHPLLAFKEVKHHKTYPTGTTFAFQHLKTNSFSEQRIQNQILFAQEKHGDEELQGVQGEEVSQQLGCDSSLFACRVAVLREGRWNKGTLFLSTCITLCISLSPARLTKTFMTSQLFFQTQLLLVLIVFPVGGRECSQEGASS